MTRFMLDTNVCVELIRGRAPGLFNRLRRYDPDSIAISSITQAELHYGAEKSSDPDRHDTLLLEFLAPLAILPFDDRAAATYGTIRTKLEQDGIPIGPLDTLIAAHALSLNLTVITNNEREFRRVKGLRVENWLK